MLKLLNPKIPLLLVQEPQVRVIFRRVLRFSEGSEVEAMTSGTPPTRVHVSIPPPSLSLTTEKRDFPWPLGLAHEPPLALVQGPHTLNSAVDGLTLYSVPGEKTTCDLVKLQFGEIEENKCMRQEGTRAHWGVWKANYGEKG